MFCIRNTVRLFDFYAHPFIWFVYNTNRTEMYNTRLVSTYILYIYVCYTITITEYFSLPYAPCIRDPVKDLALPQFINSFLCPTQMASPICSFKCILAPSDDDDGDAMYKPNGPTCFRSLEMARAYPILAQAKLKETENR